MPETVKMFELIRVHPGHEEELMEELMKLPQVTETHLLAGKFDVMATMAFEKQIVDEREQMIPVIFGKIRKMPIVRDTSTIAPAISLMREVNLSNPERRVFAFVFISTKFGKEQDVMRDVFKLDGVAESHLLLGKSDILAVLHFEKDFPLTVSESAARIVTERIAKVENILGTQTLCPLRSITK